MLLAREATNQQTDTLRSLFHGRCFLTLFNHFVDDIFAVVLLLLFDFSLIFFFFFFLHWVLFWREVVGLVLVFRSVLLVGFLCFFRVFLFFVFVQIFFPQLSVGE